jgi:hypothetical protein
MAKVRNAHKISDKQPDGISIWRWENDIKMNIEELGSVDMSWFCLDTGRDVTFLYYWCIAQKIVVHCKLHHYIKLKK